MPVSQKNPRERTKRHSSGHIKLPLVSLQNQSPQAKLQGMANISTYFH